MNHCIFYYKYSTYPSTSNIVQEEDGGIGHENISKPIQLSILK